MDYEAVEFASAGAGAPQNVQLPEGMAASATLMRYHPAVQLDPTSTVILFGPRRSGKSVMTMDFLYHLRNKLDAAVAFAPTEDTVEEFEKHLPRPWVYAGFDKAVLQSILAAQKESKRAIKESDLKSQRGGGSSPLKLANIGIIMDDCMFDKSATKSTDMRWVFMNGRHDNIFFMNTVQYLMDISIELRSNIDLVVVFPTGSAKLITKMRENLLTCFETDEDVADAFSTLKEHEALVFDRAAFDKKQPYLFFYKANPNLGNFLIGSRDYWKLYYSHFERRQMHEASKRIFNRVMCARQADDGAAAAGDAPAEAPRVTAPRASKFTRVESSAPVPPKPAAARAPRAAALPSQMFNF